MPYRIVKRKDLIPGQTIKFKCYYKYCRYFI